MSYRHLLTLLGAVLIAFGVIQGGWMWMAVWLGVDFLILGVAHGRGAHRVFGKRPNGTLPAWSWLVFLPLLAYTSLVWHLVRLLSREPARQAVNERLVIGRRQLARELEGAFDNYVDLTAEFGTPHAIGRAPGYVSFPVLDGAAPTPEALRDAVRRLRPGRTFVHCAQGHGRTGLFTLAVLLESGSARSIEEGLQVLRAIRPGIVLNPEQRRCLQMYAERAAERAPQS